MRTLARINGNLEPFLETLKHLPFVRQVRLDAPAQGGAQQDTVLTIVDPEKRRFEYSAEIKRSYLDRPLTNAVIARAQRASEQRGRPVLLLARYVPSPTGERLIDAGVNFVDRVGNMHLALGTRYGRTILGRSEEKRSHEHLSMTAAQMQLLFLFATYPEAASWPVREIAAKAGVSKSKAAAVRSDMVASGLITQGPSARFRLTESTEELLVSGYARILRPKLMLGRFRAPDREISDFLKRLPEAFDGKVHQFAVTGGPAADALQHFYQGPEAPVFVSGDTVELRQRLHLLPDRSGPIILLRAFGDLVFWREVNQRVVAPPWLIYSELMNAHDPRAHEAAAELRQELLAP